MTQSDFLTHIESTLASLSFEALTPFVSLVIGRAQAKVSNWSYQRLSGGMGGGVGGTAIYRLQGDAQTPHKPETHHWSLIIKVLQTRRDETSSDSHWWRREAEAYQSGILIGLAPHITAPRFIDITEYPGDSCWLWLEDVPDDYPGQWLLEQHILAVRHLGQFSAIHIQRRPLPHLDWLSQNWIRQDVNRFGRQVLPLDELRRHPLIARWLTDTTMANLKRLWDEREVFLSALDGLPETMCHYDAFRRNLISRDDQTVLLDWSFVGTGPLGAELVAPFWVNAIFEEIDTANLRTLEAALFDSFIAGLHDTGWRGDVNQVRLGYCAALGLRWLAGVGIQAGEIAGKLANGQPVAESYIDSMTAAGHIITQRVDEARQLMTDL